MGRPGGRDARKGEAKIHDVSSIYGHDESLFVVTVCGETLELWAEVVTRHATCMGCVGGRRR